MPTVKEMLGDVGLLAPMVIIRIDKGGQIYYGPIISIPEKMQGYKCLRVSFDYKDQELIIVVKEETK